MHIGQALDLVSRYDSLRNPLTSLGDYLDPELISRCPSAIIQARQRLGSEAVRRVFTKTAQLWHNATPHPPSSPLLFRINQNDGRYGRT